MWTEMASDTCPAALYFLWSWQVVDWCGGTEKRLVTEVPRSFSGKWGMARLPGSLIVRPASMRSLRSLFIEKVRRDGFLNALLR